MPGCQLPCVGYRLDTRAFQTDVLERREQGSTSLLGMNASTPNPTHLSNSVGVFFVSQENIVTRKHRWLNDGLVRAEQIVINLRRCLCRPG
jgi:hypothetical protein